MTKQPLPQPPAIVCPLPEWPKVARKGFRFLQVIRPARFVGTGWGSGMRCRQLPLKVRLHATVVYCEFCGHGTMAYGGGMCKETLEHFFATPFITPLYFAHTLTPKRDATRSRGI